MTKSIGLRLSTICATALVAAITAPTYALAGIVCKGGYQLVRGEYLATPYCQDIRLAQVAREYGMKVAASDILYNPYAKRHVCYAIGGDIRVQTACVNINPIGRGRPR